MIELRLPWDSQPQGVAPLNLDLGRLCPTSVYSGGSGNLLLGRRAYLGSTAATDTTGISRYGLGFNGARVTNGGLNFGNVQLLTSDTYTILVLANPGNADGVSTLFSQRNGSPPYNQLDFAVNSDDSLALSAGKIAYTSLDTSSGGRAGTSTAATYCDGAFHAYALVGNGIGAFCNMYFDGASVSSSTAGGGSVTMVSIAQHSRIGNIGDYTADGAYAATCDIPLVLIYDGIALSADEIAWVSREVLAGRAFWAEPITIPVPVSAGGATTHATAGALTGAGSTVAGTAARTRVHPSSGVLTGPGAIVDGAAARTGSATEHATTGALIGPGSTIDGTAAHIAIHGTSGALIGQGAVIAGTAARVAGAVTHETSGALVGPGSLLDGAANGPAVLTAAGGGGWLPRMRRKTRKELHAERVRLGILPPDVVKAAQKAAAVVLDEPSPAKAYRADPEAVNRVFLRELGATKMLPDYTRAIKIQIEIMQQEEEEILLLL